MNVITEAGAFFTTWKQTPKPVVLFGAGSRGKIWATLICGMHIPVHAICDSSRAECSGIFYDDIPVFPIEKLNKQEEYYVLITPQADEVQATMINQLAQSGIRCQVFVNESFQRICASGGKKRFMSYAENFEDLVLHHALRNVDEVFYVDIGANDPWRGSVTNHFYMHGGRGVNIDASKRYIFELNKYRTRDININVAVGNKKEMLEFYTDYETLESAYFPNFYAQFGKESTIEMVPCDTLGNILREHNVGSTASGVGGMGDICFCKIDVEGYERQVLQGVDWKAFRPWVFCIECVVPAALEKHNIWTNRRWDDILHENGYTFALYDVNNSYYVANEKNALVNDLLPSWYLLQMYDCFQVNRVTVAQHAVVEDYFYY